MHRRYTRRTPNRAPPPLDPLPAQPDHRKVVGPPRRLIHALGLRPIDAAAIMDVTKHVVNHWVSGRIYPHPHALLRLCRARGVDFNFLFLGDWSRLPHDVAARLDEAMRDHAAQVSAQAAA